MKIIRPEYSRVRREPERHANTFVLLPAAHVRLGEGLHAGT
jgi:hypothetical protein